ncbi:hypothetical protein BV20DRAFT_1052460 [Pilatotrama ljubarskyi]|nr:hypothetical protein BV20DRAFT_1052460 [Pilatotrama ljubarskyi]
MRYKRDDGNGGGDREGEDDEEAQPKPVPFTLILDTSFEVWLKEVGRPYSLVSAICNSNEADQGMLCYIPSILLEKLVDRVHGGDKSEIPNLEYLAPSPRTTLPPVVAFSGNTATYVVG